MRQHYPALFRSLFQSHILLGELGIIEPKLLRQSVDDFLSNGGDYLRVSLFHALKTELWLRARSRERAPEWQGEVGRAGATRAGTSEQLAVVRHGAAACAGQSPVFR
jgi:hypothetical protein